MLRDPTEEELVKLSGISLICLRTREKREAIVTANDPECLCATSLCQVCR
jgi:hypothetical protein